jgi:hypothetical protein
MCRNRHSGDRREPKFVRRRKRMKGTKTAEREEEK